MKQNIPPVIKIYNQNLNTQTQNACTIFAIVHMLLHNNIVKDKVWVTEAWLAIYCERLINEWILTPTGSRMDEVMDYMILWIKNKKRRTIMTKAMLIELIDSGYAVVWAISSDLIWDWADDGIVQGNLSATIQNHGHAVCFFRQGENIMAYDSYAKNLKYQINQFYDRIPHQIWGVQYSVI